MTELDRTVEYTYDSLYRLTSETITEGEKVTVYTYAYDNVSNRILKTENGAETEYVYNALNQLVSDSNTSYEYDLNGNLVRVIGSAQSALYEYNSENKLFKATVQNGSLVIEESYTYDYEGNRTSKTIHRSDGVTEYVKYLNDNSSLTNVLAEIDENGTVKCTYTIGADLVSQERDGKVSVYLYDGHGSVIGLANENGVVTDTYSYDAFGNLLKSTGATANNYRYCGEQFDETTGLYYLRARYMDTSTGRFISQDSYAGSISDPISLHKYLYANANPVMNSDPSGYMSAAELTLGQACLLMIGSGVVSGLINMGLSILHDLTYEKELNNIGVYICDFLIGFCSGAALAGIGILAATFMATWVFMVFAAGGIYGAYTSFVASEFESNQGEGHEDLARAYWWLGFLNIASSITSLNTGFEILSAKATAQTATDTSTPNSNVCGKQRAPKDGEPYSKYTQLDNENPDLIVTETIYNKFRRTWIRKDYYVGKKSRTHFNKTTHEKYYDHMHIYYYNDKGQIIGEDVYPILPNKGAR